MAKAVVDEGGFQSPKVIPYLSHGILTQEQADAAQTAPSGDQLAFQNSVAAQKVTPTRPDDRADRFTGVQHPTVSNVGVRPDDRADRFAHSDVAPKPEVSGGGWDIEWSEGLSFGIGALVLVLALGLGLGYLRRPRIAL